MFIQSPVAATSIQYLHPTFREMPVQFYKEYPIFFLSIFLSVIKCQYSSDTLYYLNKNCIYYIIAGICCIITGICYIITSICYIITGIEEAATIKSLFGGVMLVPYFMAYLLHNFYDLKTKCDRKKNNCIFEISVKNTPNEKKIRENKQSKPL